MVIFVLCGVRRARARVPCSLFGKKEMRILMGKFPPGSRRVAVCRRCASFFFFSSFTVMILVGGYGRVRRRAAAAGDGRAAMSAAMCARILTFLAPLLYVCMALVAALTPRPPLWRR